jgi:putative ABC transport system permease protein
VAAQSRLVRQQLTESVVLTLPAGVLGVAAAYPGTRLVRHLLFETVPLDPAAYSGAVLVLGAAAATACLVPALRATRLRPAAVLRGE